MKRRLSILFILTPLVIYASVNDSILSRIESHTSGINIFIGTTWENPALKYFSQESALSILSVGYTLRDDSRHVDPQLGDGSSIVGLSAGSFIPAGDNSAAWGNAGYSTGTTRNIKWNESSDPNFIYPYFTADEAGGNLKDEYYRFAGGYAVNYKHVTWGATLGYTAAHHFRDIDPRPRNITGELAASAGVAIHVSHCYQAGISLNLMKYKQSNEVSFINETKDLPLYQLTGLVAHYNRFAGASKTADFSGHRIGGTLNLYPKTSGFLMNLSAYRFSFEKILRDLNKLPVASAWHNSLLVEFGYKNLSENYIFALYGDFHAYRRHGSENIFDDATSGSYPQIGSIEMYADNRYMSMLHGYASFQRNHSILSLSLHTGFTHRKEIHAETEQWSLTEGVQSGIGISIMSLLGKRWYGSAEVSCLWFSPTDTGIALSEEVSIPVTLTESVMEGFRNQSSTYYVPAVNLTAARAITRNYALGLTASGSLAFRSACPLTRSINVALNFYF